MYSLGLLVSLLAWFMTGAQPAAVEPSRVTFNDVASLAGLSFVDVSGGLRTKKYLMETTGNGLAWIDYRPGWLPGPIFGERNHHRRLSRRPGTHQPPLSQ